jgi:hypothetical protein
VKENGTSSPVPKSVTPVPAGDDFFPLNMSNTPNSLSPVSRDESKGHPERKRKYSDDDSLEVCCHRFFDMYLKYSLLIFIIIFQVLLPFFFKLCKARFFIYHSIKRLTKLKTDK